MAYKRNFLKKVVLGLDFTKIELGKLKAFHKKYAKTFPIIEEVPGAEGSFNFNFKTKEIKQVAHAISAWNIFNKTRTVRINFTPVSITIEHSSYSGISQIISEIDIIQDFLTTFEVKTINKLRLRYINEITIAEKDPLNWKDYINNSLIESINFVAESGKSLARSMGVMVLKDESGDTSFNYGLWNPAFPSEISDKFFILDFDTYSKFPVDVESMKLEETLLEYHSKIIKLFELSIKEGLRRILNK